MQAKKRVRDYKKEYQARVKRARYLSKLTNTPISLAQARGHAKTDKGETPINLLKKANKLPNQNTTTLKKVKQAISELRAGKSLTATAKKMKMSPNTLKRIGEESKSIKKEGGKYKYIRRFFDVYAKRIGIISQVEFDAKNSSIMGTYHNRIKEALRDKTKRKELKRFIPKTVKDIHGNKYTLETDFENLSLMGALDRFDVDDINADFSDDEIYRRMAA